MRAAMGAIQRLDANRYRVSIELPPVDGKRKRKTKVVRGTRSEAETVLARMKLDAGKRVDTDGITLSAYWDAFYEPTLSRVAPSTASGYRYTWDGLVRPLFGDREMGYLKAREIERGLLTIEKPGAQRNAYKLLRQMYNEAWRDEIVDENPMQRRIRLKRMEHYEPEILLLDDLPSWLDAIRGSRFEAVLVCMLFGGMRREEACALFWEDFEFGVDACSARVDKTLTEVRGKVVEGPTKTAESTRSVFFAGWPASRLLELSDMGPLVPDANGKRMRPDKVSKEYRKLVESNGAKYVPMKNLRNSYATIMQGLGASDSLISKSLGHTNLKIDYAHYFAANAPAQMENARMLGDAVLHRVTS